MSERGSALAGLGVGLVDVGRVRRLLARRGERLVARCLSERERERMRRDPAEYVAGRLAAKFAVRHVAATRRPLRELEIVPDAGGAPALWIDGARVPGQLSLAHERELAVATWWCGARNRGASG